MEDQQRVRLIILAVSGLLFGLGGYGYYWYQQQKEANAAIEEAAAPTVTVRLPIRKKPPIATAALTTVGGPNAQQIAIKTMSATQPGTAVQPTVPAVAITSTAPVTQIRSVRPAAIVTAPATTVAPPATTAKAPPVAAPPTTAKAPPVAAPPTTAKAPPVAAPPTTAKAPPVAAPPTTAKAPPVAAKPIATAPVTKPALPITVATLPPAASVIPAAGNQVVVVSTPSGDGKHYPAIALEQAAAAAKANSGRQDPVLPITNFLAWPRETQASPGNGAEALLALVPPPPPANAKLKPQKINEKLVPPPPPTEASGVIGGLPIDQLPVPPSKPTIGDKMRVLAVLDDKAIISFPRGMSTKNKWPKTITLGTGEQFESLTVVSVGADGITIEEDGERSLKPISTVK